ncbi:iron-sulfur cluster carrier protein ApbC, partial [Xanthomonas sp. Kuri4-3]
VASAPESAAAAAYLAAASRLAEELGKRPRASIPISASLL